jgi:uncharacterized protein (DUF2147 family)
MNLLPKLKYLLFLSLTLISITSQAQKKSYKATIEAFRTQRITNLKAEHGWLNLVGLFWLKEGKNYFGKIIWLQEPNNEKGQPKLDANNPDPAKKNKPILGSLILRNFQYDNGEWNNGKIYDPMNGKEYKCIIKLKEPNTLNVRGYIGFSMLGRTEVWTRLK